MGGHRYPTRWKLGRHIPPPSLTLTLTLTQAKAAVVVVDSKRRKDERHILSLPNEILLNILVLVPLQVLHEVVRYVCKHLNDIVDDPTFITTLRDVSSTGGFLIQETRECDLLRAKYIEGDTPQLKITQIQLPFRSLVMGSCNGLLLLLDWTYTMDVLHVVNPVTKLKITLPPLSELSNKTTCFALTSSGQYKVVNIIKTISNKVKMRVFTVGVDKAWKVIHLQSIHVERKMPCVFPCRPCVADKKWIYWHSVSSFFGFALDVDDETVYPFRKPEGYIHEHGFSRFIRLGTGLGVVTLVSETWQFWELTDIISSKWSKVAELDYMKEVISRVDKSLSPRWCELLCPLRLVNGYLWFSRAVHIHYSIHKDFAVVRCSLADKSFEVFMVSYLYKYSVLHPHVPTLFSPKNC